MGPAMEGDVSQLDDVFTSEEDGFEFGQPIRTAAIPMEAPRAYAPAPPPLKIAARGLVPNAAPRHIPTQKTFSTLFATDDTVSLPREPKVKVNAELHPLEQARRTFGLSQKDLALRSGVGIQTIRRFEQGLSNPKLSTLRKLSASLNTPIDVISAA